MSDLVKTIEEDDEPSDLSEDSVSDEEFQPTRKRAKATTSGGFDPTFDFGHYTKDTWSERLEQITKVKLPKRSTLDEKINKRKNKNLNIQQSNGINGNNTVVVKDDDLNETVMVDSSDSDSDSESKELISNGKIHEDGFESDDSITAVGPKEKKMNTTTTTNKTNKKTTLMNKKQKKQNEESDEDDISLSEDELQEDEIRVKERKGKNVNKKTKKMGHENDDDDDDDEEIIDNDEKLLEDPNYIFQTNLSFQQMNLSRPLLKSITSLGFIHPTPIQAAAIPVALAGRDICGCAATGTGKTAAYMLPVLERLLYKPKSNSVTRVLCLVPTRELGVQVYTVTKQLGSFSNDIQIGLAVGGLDVQAQEAILRRNPDIVIATPGRLIDHLGNTPSFTLDSIEILILDEADRMLDDWFAEQLKEIIRQCNPRRQTLLFSATMTDRVKDLISVSLKNPSKIFVDSNKQVAFNLRQQFVRIRNESDREAMLCSLVVRTFHSRTMVFVPTKKIAHRLHILLGLLSIRIGELHGDLTQIQRLDSLKKFQHGEVDVLIVTDVAARGLDIPGVQSVLNFTMPPTLEQYIHRCGRTARAGKSGVAVSLVGEQDRKLMKQVAKSATHPVKSRIVPPDMIIKYRDKVGGLEPQLESIMTEEEADRTIAKAEIEANKAIKMLEIKKAKKKNKKKEIKEKNDPNRRVWFQTHKDRAKEKDNLKAQGKGGKKKGRTTADDRRMITESEENIKLKKLSEFQARDAKRKRRNRVKPQEIGKKPGIGFGKKKKNKSHFENELTNTSSAREFRHQPKKSIRKFNQKMKRK